MADIEDRAEKWAREHIQEMYVRADGITRWEQNLIEAYLAGSAQTQADYTAPRELSWHYGPTPADPDPGKMWHNGCGREILFIDGGAICECGAQD